MSYALSARRPGGAHHYADLGLQTQVMSASPVRLITLLFDGARAALARARAQRSDAAARGAAISRAIDIIENGLQASLDMEAGGEVAISLRHSYELMVRKLLLANLKNDMQQFDDAERLLIGLGTAWRAANDPQAAPAP